MSFKIGIKEIAKRRRNILFGALFSILLALFIVYHNYQYPEKYNDVLFWSVIGFVFLANLVNYYRYRIYLLKLSHHSLEILPEQIQFNNKDDVSVLDINEVAALNLYRRRGNLSHIQIKLKNNRGIRLEGYDDMEKLCRLICEQVPKAHINDG